MATPTHSYVRYESRDVAAPTVLKCFAVLTAAIVASFLIVSGSYRIFIRWQRGVVPASISSLPAERILPPEPRLQGAPGHEEPPAEELRHLRGDATAKLNSYGWVDHNGGIARIPISEAMRMLADKDLSAAPKAATLKERSR